MVWLLVHRRNELLSGALIVYRQGDYSQGLHVDGQRARDSVQVKRAALCEQRRLVMSRTVSGVFRTCERRGPRGSGDGSPSVGSRGKEGSGGRFFVNECLNFDVLDEKISKTAKYTIIKIMVS